ncbi:hypothetical protein CC78DRAFT_585496 [Lojkania enalia]|uniref:Uncharacterized protein n=1 Tax=Lojkania enalia TaxID=147567 RepID=A0A9P4K1X1_9PLEO|nr:hypothetical protein CC78DRAFT_585496 [Didymosphaeria enalia]
MAAPGYSLFELYQTARKAKQIWDAFHGEFDNAPARVRELVETCDYLSRVLFDFCSLLEQLGENYPHERNFDRKLEECRKFIDEYWALKDDYQTKFVPGRTRTWKQIWYSLQCFPFQNPISVENHDRQTTKYVYDTKRAQELKDGLSLEIQKLLAYTVVFALKRSAPVNYSASISNARSRIVAYDEPIPALDTSSRLAIPPIPQESELEGLRHELAEFQGLFQDLVGIRYSYEREMNSAVQRNEPANIEPIRQRLELVWHRLYVRSGLIAEDSPTPPLPRDPRELLEAPARNYDRLVINTAAPSLHDGLRTNTNVRQFAERGVERVGIDPTLSRNHSSHIRSHIPSTYSSSSVSYPTSRTSSVIAPSLFSISDATAHTTPYTTPYLAAGQSTETADDSLLPQPAIPSAEKPVARIYLHIQQEPLNLVSWTVKTVHESRLVEWETDSNDYHLLHEVPNSAFPHIYHSTTSQNLDVTFDDPHKISLVSGDMTLYSGSTLVEYTFFSPNDRDTFQAHIRNMTHVNAFDIDVIWSNIDKKTSWGNLAGMATLEKLNLWQSDIYPYYHSLSFVASRTTGEQTEYPLLAFSNPPHYSSRHREVRLSLAKRRTSGSSHSRRNSVMSRLSRRPSDPVYDMPHDPPGSPTFAQETHDATHLEHISIKFTKEMEYENFRRDYEHLRAEDESMALAEFGNT